MDKDQKCSNRNITLPKECVGILSLPTKFRDRTEYNRVIHSERNVWHHCVIFVYLESDLSAWMHVCVRFVCCGSMTQFSGHAGTSLSLSLSILQKISLASHPTGFYSVATEITIVPDLVCAFSRNGSQHETFL